MAHRNLDKLRQDVEACVGVSSEMPHSFVCIYIPDSAGSDPAQRVPPDQVVGYTGRGHVYTPEAFNALPPDPERVILYLPDNGRSRYPTIEEIHEQRRQP